MAKTQPPVNVNSSNWTAVYVTSPDVQVVTVQETGQAATTDYLVAYPTSSDGPKTCAAGKEFPRALAGLFQPFPAGPPVMYLKTVTGSVNFDVHEQ